MLNYRLLSHNSDCWVISMT